MKQNSDYPRVGAMMMSCCVALALMCAGAAPVRAQEGQSLLSNGGFEHTTQVKGGVQPTGWTLPAQAVLDSDHAHSGHSAARLTVAKVEGNSPRIETDYIPASGEIEVSAWVKTSRVLQGDRPWHQARVYFVIFDKDHQIVHELIGGHQDVAMAKGTTPWTQYQWKGRLPENVAYIRVMCTLTDTTGVAWFDDVEVVSFPETAAQKRERLMREQMLEPLKATQVNGPSSRIDPLQRQKAMISMDPVELPDRSDIKRPDFFATIRGDGFYVDGKRRFLLGAEGSATVYPYLYHLMGFDFVELGDFYHVTSFKQEGDKWHVSWGVEPYYAIELDKMLDARIMPYAALMERGKVERHPLFDDFPRMFAERGHFLSFSPLNPVGEKIRWNNRKSIMAGLGDRPVWMWEMFNEVSYRCHDQANLEAFRRWARGHYGDIAHANAAWGTDFDSFAAVVPPNPGYFVMARGNTFPKGASKPLFYDFMTSQEEVFGAYGVRSLDKMHGLDPLGYVTVQSHCSLPSDYGNIGVNPFLKARGEDVYGTEIMMHLYIQGHNDPDEIADMLKSTMVNDIVRAAAGNRPIVNEESTLNGRGGPKLETHELIDLKGTWQFFPLPGDGKRENTAPPGLDAPGWTTIQVPGLWGKQGHPHTQAAWYRHTFRLPDQSSFKDDQKLLLEGKSLSDLATLYVNGHKVHQTQKWNEGFSVDVGDAVHWGGQNVLTIRIENHALRSGFYWGGIRRYVRLVAGQPWRPQPMTAGQMRTYIWNKAAHGCDGSVMSYFYDNAAFKGYYSPFSPYNRQPEALMTVAPTHKLINNLASLVLPASQRGRVALVYPMTSMRAHIAKNYHDYITGPLTTRLTRYYGALMFNHVPLDMAIDENLPDLKRYQAVVVAVEPSIRQETLRQLEDYVRQGGVLMVAADSLVTNGDTYTPLGEIPWLPDRDQTGADQSGKAVGKGHVYMLAADATLPELRTTVGKLLKRSHIEPDLTVKQQGDVAASCVEAEAFAGDRGRTVWYLLNWGATCQAMVGSKAFSPQGTYRVRDAAARKIIPSPTDQPTWTAEQLSDGIALTISCQDPRVILIEPAAAPLLPLPRISEELRRKINEAFGPTIKGDRRILFSTLPTNARMTPVRIPTAVTQMEQAGWGVYTSLAPITAGKPMETWGGRKITPRSLNDFQILVFGCPQGNISLPKETVEAARQFVSNGGGLLLLPNPPHGPHGWLSPDSLNQIAEVFGVKIDRHMVTDKQHARDGHALLPVLTNIGDHPITAGVKSFDPDGTAWLHIDKSTPTKVVIRTNDTSDPANAPVMAMVQYGKGRVVIMGSGYWLEPTIFDNADNQRLLSNIITWLVPQ